MYSRGNAQWETSLPRQRLSHPFCFLGMDSNAADHNQLTLILDVLGTPSMDDYLTIRSRRAREYLKGLPVRRKVPFRSMFPNANPLALDLLDKLLTFNPMKRITVEEALQHKYLEPYHDPEDEPDASPIPDSFFDFDKHKDQLSTADLKGSRSPSVTKADLSSIDL